MGGGIGEAHFLHGEFGDFTGGNHSDPTACCACPKSKTFYTGIIYPNCIHYTPFIISYQLYDFEQAL